MSFFLLDGGPPRYSWPMKVAFELAPAQAEKLRREAERLGVAPDELARAALADPHLLLAPFQNPGSQS